VDTNVLEKHDASIFRTVVSVITMYWVI